MRPLGLLLLASCALPAAPEYGLSWPVETFFRARDRDFGGFNTSRLAVQASEPVPWRPGATATRDAVVVHPAYEGGAPAAYVVTEVWEAHPDLWVQPVYQFVSSFDATDPGARHTGADGVFGVGTDSTFYSPFWRLWWAEPAGAIGPFTDVRQISRFPMHRGAIVLCPIVPDGVGLSGATHPLTGAPLQDVPIGRAWANGARVEYLNLGVNRQLVEGDVDGVVRTAPMYFFAFMNVDGTRTLLELPAVLTAGAREHAYVRRVDAVLAGEAVFVPAGHPLRAPLEGRVSMPSPDPAISAAVANAHLLRVAKSGACFASAATFPSGCEWLDSESAVRQHFAADRLLETNVTLTATAVHRP